MTEKELAIKRSAVFLAERADHYRQTGNRKLVTQEAIEELLNREFEKVPDVDKAKIT